MEVARRPLEIRRLLQGMAKSEVYRKRNQLRLPNPFVPLPRKTTNTLCGFVAKFWVKVTQASASRLRVNLG
jgi:hypothetical protein